QNLDVVLGVVLVGGVTDPRQRLDQNTGVEDVPTVDLVPLEQAPAGPHPDVTGHGFDHALRLCPHGFPFCTVSRVPRHAPGVLPTARTSGIPLRSCVPIPHESCTARPG